MPITAYSLPSTIPGIPGRTVRVWTPDGPPPSRPCPLWVFHDGQNVFAPGGAYGCWHAEDALATAVARRTLPPVVAVAIDNDGDRRRIEYVPPGERYRQGPLGQADAYARFVLEDVLPFVAARYPVSTAPADTVTIGSSLGGVISLYLAFATPRFGTAASLSTAICWAPRFAASLAGRPRPALRIYHDIGALETAEMAPDPYGAINRDLDATLASLGLARGRDLTFVVDPEGRHHESAWARRLPAVLAWWGGARSRIHA